MALMGRWTGWLEQEGLLTGISGGATFYAALETAKKGERTCMHARVYACTCACMLSLRMLSLRMLSVRMLSVRMLSLRMLSLRSRLTEPT